jgi:quercetin dioxygenase-like cupin family protein
MHCFIPLHIRPGLLHSTSQSEHPTAIWGWGEEPLELPDQGTCFGMVTAGGARLDLGYGAIPLRRGMFFVINDGGRVAGGAGLTIFRPDYRGMLQIGGPLEAKGRLQYIDGCSDTLWVCPPRLGEPCLNHLHIPPHTDQTQHTHPSDRIGVIMEGSGECRTPDGVHPLAPGMGWIIPAGSLHSFFTREEALDVVAWHPDSDFGPADQDHPMINRTLIPE